jgi:hypothetical protein
VVFVKSDPGFVIMFLTGNLSPISSPPFPVFWPVPHFEKWHNVEVDGRENLP